MLSIGVRWLSVRNDASVGKACDVFSCELSGWIRLLSLLTCLFVVLGMLGCTQSASEPEPSVTWRERETPDIVTIAVPRGWVLLGYGERSSRYDLKIASSHSPSTNEGIAILNQEPSIAGLHGRDGYMRARRDQWMADDVKVNRVKDPEPIGPRMIGGSQAWGYSGMFTFNDKKTYPVQYWALWREDGQWDIYVTGFENTSTVPEELIAALDTVSFFPPNPRISSGSPSPSPSASES